MERTRQLMDAHVQDAIVEGFEPLIEGLVLPDIGDRHVLAAAIRSRSDVIVTRNLRDFPAVRLAPYGIGAQHPDTFIVHLLDLAPGRVVAAARSHRSSLRNPPKDVARYLETPERQGLTETVAVLRGYSEVI